MRITLESGPAESYLVRADTGATLLIVVDWDLPKLASAFGWLSCFCGETDGTIDCPHRTVGDMIAEARDYLDERIGETADDPGYFIDQ